MLWRAADAVVACCCLGGLVKIAEHIAREASLLEQLQEAKDQHKQALVEAREQHEHTLQDHQVCMSYHSL